MTIATTEPVTGSLPPLVLGWIAGLRSVHTRKAYLRDITDWLGWLADHGTDPLAVTEPDTAYWARHLEAGGLSASTVARKLSAMSSWYQWLVRNGHMEKNPADNLARPEVDRDTSTTPGLTKDQALALIAAADQRQGPAAIAHLGTSGRDHLLRCADQRGDRRRHRGPGHRPGPPGAVGHPQRRQAAGARAAAPGDRAAERLPRDPAGRGAPARSDSRGRPAPAPPAVRHQARAAAVRGEHP